MSPLARAAAGPTIAAIIPLFLLFANTQIKTLVEDFMGGCVFVIQKRTLASGQILVTARIAGTMPKAIPLMFEAREALINTIVFDEPYRQENITEPNDLAFHPLTGMACPGPLCEDSGSAEVRRQVQVLVRDLRPEFTYRFRVRLRADPGHAAATDYNLKVYALFDRGLEDGVCRIEPRRWFNFWVWATPLQKVALFLGVIVVGGSLVKWGKSAG